MKPHISSHRPCPPLQGLRLWMVFADKSIMCTVPFMQIHPGHAVTTDCLVRDGRWDLMIADPYGGFSFWKASWLEWKLELQNLDIYPRTGLDRICERLGCPCWGICILFALYFLYLFAFYLMLVKAVMIIPEKSLLPVCLCPGWHHFRKVQPSPHHAACCKDILISTVCQSLSLYINHWKSK